MTHPINEAELTERWISMLDNPDDADRELLEAMAVALSIAYNAGFEAGKKIV